MLLEAPDGHLDVSMFPLIEKWGDPFKAIEVLEVLDKCIYAALASGFVIQVLATILDKTIEDENTTIEEVVKSAVWRNPQGAVDASSRS